MPNLTRISQASVNYGWVCEANGFSGEECRLDVGNVASGASDEVEFIVVVDENQALSPTDNLITNTVSILDDEGNGPDPILNNGRDSEPTQIPFSDISIEKTTDKQTAKIDENITYTFIARNNGPAPATEVVMSDTLPNDLEFIRAFDESGEIAVSQNGQTIDILIGDLGALETKVINIETKVLVDSSKDLLNAASIRALQADPEISNNTDSATVTLELTPNRSGGTGLDRIIRTGGARESLSLSFILLGVIGVVYAISRDREKVRK